MGKMILNGKEYAGSGSEWHEYSTDEKVVGKWIDGKPIYEKTISKNNIRIENAVQFNHDIANLGICVRAFVFMYDSSTGVSYNLESGADTGGNSQSIGARVYPNYIYFQGGQNFNASTNRTWYFTLQYTKTTD